MRLALLGLNHKTAPLELREGMALTTGEIPGMLQALAAHPAVAEVMWLSTCNRVEIYVVPTGETTPLDAVEALVLEAQKLDPATFQAHGYRADGRAAAAHFLRVAASLDSMVVGEPQILGQVKAAAEIARRAATMGPILNRVVQLTVQAAKRTRTETGIGKMRVSVGSVAVDLARRIFGHLDDCRVLIVGAGKMGEITGKAISRAGAPRVYVTNRSADRARALADKHGWSARGFDELEDLLGRVDVVLTSTGAARPIIGERLIRRVIRARKYRPLFIVDIAVPRDVEPSVGDLDTVYLYNVDDLVAISDTNQETRQTEVLAAERLLESALADIQSWYESLSVQPTLVALREHADGVAMGELQRSFAKKLKHLSPADQTLVEQAMKTALAKVLHPTMVALKGSVQGTGSAGLAAAARVLYGLDETPREPQVDGPPKESSP